VKKTKGQWVRVHSLIRSTSSVKGHARAPRWGLWWVTSKSIIHMYLHKPNNKLINAYLEYFWCMDEPRANTNSQDSPWFGFGGSHHLPPYNTLYAWPWGFHPNVILSRDSQVGVSKFLKLGLLWFWRPITLCVDLWLKWSMKQSCSLLWEISKSMWHVNYTQKNEDDSWFLMVRSQIVNLTFDPSFGHNLCFKCPNGSCKPSLNIYVSRAF
jgi:hypothetical protein